MYFTSQPEEIRLLRYPFFNNPNMSREAVWAYTKAIDIKSGIEWDVDDLHDSLKDLVLVYPTFNSLSAIKVLGDLNVVSLKHTKELATRIKDDYELT
jgi:hypothetical protein